MKKSLTTILSVILWLGMILAIGFVSGYTQAQEDHKIRINERGRAASFNVYYDNNYKAWVVDGEPAVFIYNFKTGEGFKVYVEELIGTVKK